MAQYGDILASNWANLLPIIHNTVDFIHHIEYLLSDGIVIHWVELPNTYSDLLPVSPSPVEYKYGTTIWIKTDSYLIASWEWVILQQVPKNIL